MISIFCILVFRFMRPLFNICVAALPFTHAATSPVICHIGSCDFDSKVIGKCMTAVCRTPSVCFHDMCEYVVGWGEGRGRRK